MAKRLKGKKERELLFRVKGKMERQEKREKVRKTKVRKKAFGVVKGAFKRKKVKAGRRAVAKRARGTGRFLGALGVISAKDVRGPGRPRGTYKYRGMPIHEYKKLQSRKRALLEIYREKQNLQLRRRGLSPEQISQLQFVKTAREGGIPIDVIETPQGVMSAADEELAFRKFAADKTISPNTQNILRRLRRTQLKSKTDDVIMQRRLKERKMVASAGNLLETPFVFKEYQMDITGVHQDNILLAPSVFRENPEDNILRQNRLNVMQTREAGNNLRFF